MAELNLVSDSLVDWFLSKPHLVTKGVWPMRNVVCICNFLCSTGSHERATQLAETVLIRLHSASFQAVEQEEMVEALVALQALLTKLPLVRFPQTGNVDQHIQMLRVLHRAMIPFEFESFDNLGLEQQNEPMLLEVMAELNLVSDSLVDWFLSKPDLVTKGGWPMRNVVCICYILRASGSHERATQLVENVLIRLHSTSFLPAEQEETIEVLITLQALLTHLPVMQFLETGDAGRRMCVLVAAAQAGLAFDTSSLVKLAQCLLHEDIAPSSSNMSKKTELCSKFMRGNCQFAAACYFAHGRHDMVCKNWMNGTCTRGKKCYLQHGEMGSLLARVLTAEVDEENIQGTHMKHAHTNVASYLLDVLRPGSSSVGPVQQVFDGLVFFLNGAAGSTTLVSTTVSSSTNSTSIKTTISANTITNVAHRYLATIMELDLKEEVNTLEAAGGDTKSNSHDAVAKVCVCLASYLLLERSF